MCAIRKSKKLKTFLAFLDVSKAFDTIDRPLMFTHLWAKGVQGKMWRIIKSLYAQVDNRVIFGPFQTDPYQVVNGVKQGCILSPCLFNLIMCDLDDMLMGSGDIELNGTRINGLYYADDIILFGKDEENLERMLSIAAKFALKWNLSFNDNKSQIMVIGEKCRNRTWQLGDKMISETVTVTWV